MTNPVDSAIADLVEYIQSHNTSISPRAKSIFRLVEEIGSELNQIVYPGIYFLACMKEVRDLRLIVARLGGDLSLTISEIERCIVEDHIDDYFLEPTPYSSLDHRATEYRAQIIDLCLAIARKNNRTEVTEIDIVEAVLECHEQEFPVTSNSTYSNEALNTPYNTIGHIYCHHSKPLWIRLDEIRRELALSTGNSAFTGVVESAPPEARSAILSLLADYPDTRKNAFLIMPFTPTTVHEGIAQSLKEVLRRQGFTLFRADDYIYSDDLLINIQAYIHASRFGIAVFERMLDDRGNNNVSLEVGYMMALKKPICLLKERSIRTLQSDLIGKLYMQFDIHEMENSIEEAVTQWLKVRGIVRAV